MKRAWIENGKIRDLTAGKPDELFHPAVASNFDISVPDEAKVGDGWANRVLVPFVVSPPVFTPVELVSLKLAAMDFKMLFTPEELIAIYATPSPGAVHSQYLAILDDSRLLEVDVKSDFWVGFLNNLLTKGILTVERKSQFDNLK